MAVGHLEEFNLRGVRVESCCLARATVNKNDRNCTDL